jgi:C_GCAxxG_C_C family probable redox protein
MTVGAVSLCGVAAGESEVKAEVRKIDTERISKAAYQRFIPGKLTCCESILAAGCESLGVKGDLIPEIALGLAGGIGLQGKTCGVVTGGALVLSLAVAQRETEYAKKKMATLEAVGQFCRAFEERVGSTDCRDLCGLDLTNPENRKKLQMSVKEQTCAGYVKIGAELLAAGLREVVGQ